MAITVNNLQSASTDTLAYTPSGVTDSCLVVIVSSEDVSPLTPITGMSFGATPMVLEIVGNGVLGTNSNDVAIAYLVNPGTTSQTISVTGGQHDRLGIAALTLDNVDQSTSIDVSNGSFENTSVSVVSTTETTSNNNSFVVSGGVTGDNTASLSVVGGVEILEFSPPSTKMAIATSTQSIAGVYDHKWTSTIAGRTAAASVAFNLAVSGGVTVTPDTLNSLSISLDPAIAFNSALVLTPSTVNSNSISLNPSITFTASLELTPNTINSSSISLDPVIQFGGTLDLTPNVLNTSSVVLNPTIEFTSALVVSPQTLNSASISIDPLIEFKAVINLTPDTLNTSSVSLNPTITTGAVQSIGTVTAGFADDLYSVKYKLSGITVNFKE